MPASLGCLWTVWLVNLGPQELPGSLRGLGRLRRTEKELVNGQALPDLKHDIRWCSA